MSEHDELVALVQRIVACDGTEQEIDGWLDELQSRVPHPAVSDLIYHNDEPLSADEVVAAALSYRVVRVPPPAGEDT